MSVVITKRHESIEVVQWVTLLYGQPGIGKTSTAFTCHNPLLLDFDEGAHRSEFRKDVVTIRSWADVAGITEDDLRPYATLVVDTVGRLLDHLALDIIKRNGKMGTMAGGLTLQGYGALKSQFGQWIKATRSMGVNVLLLAHEKEDRQGDEVKIRPDIQGSSSGEVFKIADQVGYIHANNNNLRVIDFEPSDHWLGKNTGGFKTLLIPNFHSEPQFFAETMQQLLDQMNSSSKVAKEFADVADAHRDEILSLDSAEALSLKVRAVAEMEDGPLKVIMKNFVSKKAKALNLKWDIEIGAFAPVPETAEEAETTNEEETNDV